jgi:membrane protein
MDWRRWWEITRAVSRKLRDSGLAINAAGVAYNAFLALVPLTFAVLGVAGAVGRSGSAVARISDTLDPIVPLTVKEFIIDLLVDAGERVGDGSVALVVGSVLVALFFGSRAVVALQRSLAAVEDRTEQRPTVQMRLVAIGLTLGGGFVLILTSFMLVAGRTVIEFLAELTGAGLLDEVWVWMRVPIAAAGLFVFLLGLYRLGPPEPLPRAWLAALVATSGAVGGSLGFGVYLSIAPELGATFGLLGAVAIALVWLQVGALAILFGAIVAGYDTSDPSVLEPVVPQ